MAHRPPRRPSYEERRLAARRAGHIRLAILIGIVALVIILLVVLTGGSSPAAKGSGQTTTTTTTSGHHAGAGAPAVTARAASWTLNSPLSRSIVLPSSSGSSLIVAGGLEQGGAAAAGIYDVNSSDGTPTQAGNLQAPLYEAAGAVLNGKGFVFGGEETAAVSSVQVLPNLGTSVSTTAASTLVGSLPQARAGAAAVTIGGVAYLLGGSNGTTATPDVLATTDGHHFTVVANLPVPVDNATAAALDGRIYVFGGDAASGSAAGKPVDAVQMVDPATRTATVVGSLPEPVAGAAAFSLAGAVYVAGGETLSGSGGKLAAVSNIWAWLVGDKRPLLVGHLASPVAYAGLTVIGTRAWLVGGETSTGSLLTGVQTLEANTADIVHS